MGDQGSSREERGEGASPLLGQHAVVTGGGGGIGFAIAHALALRGADVSLLDMMEADALAEKAAEVAAAHGVKTGSARTDVSDEGQVKAAFAALTESLGGPGILVNCAGIAPTAPFARTEPDLWRKVLDIDLTGAYLCTRAVLDHMVAAGAGRIINIASTAGQVGYAYCTAYCAAKHGLIGLTRALALEMAKKGVTVNAVCPGFTETAIIKAGVDNIVSKTGRSEDDAKGEFTRFNPQGRLIQPTEVADAVAWLCLPGSGSVTGQSITVAGGEVMP